MSSFNPEGGFTYRPNPGFRGIDTFTYQVTDGHDIATGTITMEVLDPVLGGDYEVVYTANRQPEGGDIILIQVAALHGVSGVEVTGMHGSVLKDSVQTAYNVVRKFYRDFDISEQRFKEQKVAVHLVRIAEAREGPSAGLAFVVGMVSALTNRAVKPGCAFTGEVTLFGEVKDVGGIPQKIKAAHDAGRRIVFIPADNGRDLQSVDNEILKQMTVKPVRSVKEVLDMVLDP